MSLKTIRIKDIARLAGVSAGTVDRVLHQRGRVSEAALKKVMAVLDQIEYKPNLLARTLASNKTVRLAALIPDPNQDPYWAESWSGIVQAQADWSYYGITVAPFKFDLYDRHSFKTAAEGVLTARPQGALVAPIFYHEALSFFDRFKLAEIPLVFFNTEIPEVLPLSFIGQNLYQSGKVSAELMTYGLNPGQGGRVIILHVAEDIHNALHLAEKERGFRDYLEEKKRTDVQVETINLSNPRDPSFETQILRLVENPAPKGIFVSTSKATFQVASILEKSRQKRVRLGGYDLLEESIPFLQSGTIDFLINQNPKRQARLGISHLVNSLMFKKEIPAKELFPLEVITQQNFESYLSSGIH